MSEWLKEHAWKAKRATYHLPITIDFRTYRKSLKNTLALGSGVSFFPVCEPALALR